MRALYRSRLESSTLRDLNRMRHRLQVDPQYQREGNVWDNRRKRLLIDSLINGFDVPKIYLRQFVPAIQIGGTIYDYAVIDGRQRLEAIWEFINDEFKLAPDFSYIDDDSKSGALANSTYSDLALGEPEIAFELMKYAFDVITVETEDEELIEDMFLRLNEASPLNAAEKRNAFGGPIPPISRELAEHDFFTRCVRVSNRRFRYYEIATKFLYFEYYGRERDTKKVYLDRFVLNMSPDSHEALGKARSRTLDRLDTLVTVFERDDFLLDTVGMLSVYYLVAMRSQAEGWAQELDRASFAKFQAARQHNKIIAQRDEEAADYDLLEFDRFAQSPNDSIALRFRQDLLLGFLGHASGEPLIDAD